MSLFKRLVLAFVCLNRSTSTFKKRMIAKDALAVQQKAKLLEKNKIQLEKRISGVSAEDNRSGQGLLRSAATTTTASLTADQVPSSLPATDQPTTTATTLSSDESTTTTTSATTAATGVQSVGGGEMPEGMTQGVVGETVDAQSVRVSGATGATGVSSGETPSAALSVASQGLAGGAVTAASAVASGASVATEKEFEKERAEVLRSLAKPPDQA